MCHDQYPKLLDKLSKYKLTYQEECDVKERFHNGCKII